MKTKLQTAMKEAMKSKDKTKLDTIRLALSAIQYEEVAKGVDKLSDTEVLEVLKRELKKRKEEVEFAEKASRSDLLEKLKGEISCLESFLPTQMSPADLEKIIMSLREKTPGAKMGDIMKGLKDGYSGQYDAKLASEIVKKVVG